MFNFTENVSFSRFNEDIDPLTYITEAYIFTFNSVTLKIQHFNFSDNSMVLIRFDAAKNRSGRGQLELNQSGSGLPAEWEWSTGRVGVVYQQSGSGHWRLCSG